MQDGLEYLEDHPDLWRWMSRCPACGAVGYRPDLPEIGAAKTDELAIAVRNLRSLFSCLQLHDDGRCRKCHERRENWGPRADGFGLDE